MMFSILVFLFGLSVGSFLNVVICRLETKEPILNSRSHCPQCRAVLKWLDLIPILSFLIQKGRCRYCGKRISLQYPAVEVATGIVFLLIFYQFWNFDSGIWNLIVICFMLYVVCSMLIIFVYDLKHYIIPDKIVYPAIIIVFLYHLFRILNFGHCNLFENCKLTIGNLESLLNPFLAGLGTAAFFLSLVLISKGQWMGLGDVKLAFLMGLILGWPNILLALYLAFFSGAIIGLTLIIFGKKTIKSQIPFGPFLATSTVVVLLCSNFLTIFLDKL